jgi:hypothetical protein
MNFGIRSSRMAIRSQLAWYWRWLLNVLMMVVVGAVVWWLVENSYRITGFNREETRQQLEHLTQENQAFKRDLERAKSGLAERDRQVQIDKAAQTELARTVAQLQDENASLKEDLGFLRKVMSSGGAQEGLGVSDFKVEPEGSANEFRYRLLLMQGGQRKQDFHGKVQIVARVSQPAGMQTLAFPEGGSEVEFRFYQKVEGRFRIPDGATLKGVELRVLALPGGQVKLSRSLNIP